MAFPDSSEPPASPLSIKFHRTGPVARIFLAVLCAVGAIFIGAMAVWTTEDSWLSCTRQGGAEASCSVRSEYALQVSFDESLPPIDGAHVERRISHDRYGDHPYLVLLLDSAKAPPSEFPGVGTNGERASAVASGVDEFLSGAGEQQARWHLRDSAPRLMSAFMLVVMAGLVVLAGCAFRRASLAFDPQSKTVTLRLGRWPLGAKQWLLPIADIEGMALTEKRNRNGNSYGAQFLLRGASPVDLGVGSVSRTPIDAAIAGVEALLATWRQL